jgi:hypothetical protein
MLGHCGRARRLPSADNCAIFCATNFDWQRFAISDFPDYLSGLPPNVRPPKYRIDVKDHAAAMAVRAALEVVVMRAALEDHYAQHPEARPDLADVAIAAAEIDGNPLAADPERIRRAAVEIAAAQPNPDPEDVLLWAEAW